MRKLLLLSALFPFAGAAFGQPTVIPTCNTFDLAGAPAVLVTAGPPAVYSNNCTDYFGVGNWANSPLPAGTITGFTLINGGKGYSTPLVVISDQTNPLGTCASTGTLLGGGVVAGFGPLTGTCAGYTIPQVTIVDMGPGWTTGTATCGGGGQPACGSGAMATAIISGPFTGGMLKFQDPFVDLKSHLAASDPNTFPGSDYYEIALVQYSQKMHSSLPPTTMRGYVQVPTGSTGCPSASFVAANASYLGPTIVAAKNKAVRVKFTNCLPTGSGGNLFIPTDTTYMGAGEGPNAPLPPFPPAPQIRLDCSNPANAAQCYTENRATLHLHGGATPWISDGTPHQWTVPVGDTATYQTGVSVAYVPDMYFVGGAVVPQCSATVTTNCSPSALPAGAANNPGQGSLTFYWTNEQGGRLMFYHDHAYGITRLNVYAGEAAGYLLADSAEEDRLSAATAPGTVGALVGGATANDLAHIIPLVIQDKTFVPSTTQVAAQDPTWVGNFGASVLSALGGNGDLWFPHVYIPNQNPADPGLANGFGHWDYGAWFFPPQTTLTAAGVSPLSPTVAGSGVTIPCTSAVFPGQILGPTTACPTCGCPITPNVSGTPEGFMDTPLVNGVAYPVLHVAPAAYRFKILAAGNDRSWNLSWFIADATPPPAGIAANTEVAMLPAAVPFTGSALPLCVPINPVAVPQLGLGLVTALTDLSGNPLNGTGLPVNCWPNYGPLQGIPPAQTMWAADGRAGGSPDPRRAGPPWIQIGSEGGLLPAPVVIPATPVNYELNTRSITITSVAMHGLWLGPAERADVIVDFSQFAGKTLILYNDAPAPAPAIDSRLDYFTGDGDQSPIGGAPNTPAGYGPNTRTIMQVVVDGNAPNTVPFSLSTLKAAFASTLTTPGLFASTQPTIIVPEAAYNSAYNRTDANHYMGISDNTLTFTPIAPLNTAPCTPPAAGCVNLEQKAIQELFTLDYGRMNATLGVELPLTNFQTQTTIPLGYVDWPTEIIKQGDTQLWKVTHNGVDSHFIHFHLFNVQVINRVGWDGSLRQPDQNEMGWKDTVRMNPLEDILVALQPITPTFPFPLPDSVRSDDVTMPTATADMAISGLDPTTGNATLTNVNNQVNFGWEYVWHCHILGHEENDMMRPIIFQVPPPTPSNLVAVYVGTLASPVPGVNLNWTDNSASETTFTVQRADITDPGFATATVATFTAAASSPNTKYGGTITFNDPGAIFGTPYFYRVRADDSFTPSPPNPAQFIPGALSSGWSPVVGITTQLIAPTVTFTGAPANAAFNTSFVVTATTNASTMPGITGTAGVCNVSAVGGTPLSATATVTMIAGSGTCSLAANWPADATFLIGTASQTTTAVLATPTVSFTGAPATAPYKGTFVVTATTNAGVAPTSITGTAGVCSVGGVSAPGFPSATATVTMLSGTGTCTLTAIWPAPVAPTYSGATLTQSTTATKIAPTVTFTGAPASKVYNTSFVVTATTNASTMPTITPTGVCTVGAVGGTAANATATVTMTSGTGTCVLTAAWLTDANYLAAGPINPAISPTTAAKAASATSQPTHSPNPSLVGQAVTAGSTVTPVVALTGGAAGPTGSITVTATTGESCIASLSGGTGSCSLTFLTSVGRTMTAVYGGDANFSGSTSIASTNQPVWDFAMGSNPGSQTVNGGQKATYTLTVSSLGGFNNLVGLTCSVPQAAYTCTVAPVSVTPNGGSKNATVTVTTVKGFPGTYTLTFTGTTTLNSFTLTHTINPTITVNK